MLFDALIIVAGVAAILVLAEGVIRSSERLMRHYSVSGGLVGLTVLSFGTSLLEISTHVVGSFKILQEPEHYRALSALLIGSNIGSDIFQQNLLLPAIALAAPIGIARQKILSEVGGLVGASALLWLFCADGRLSRVEGGTLVLLYAAYLFSLGRLGRPSRGLPRRRPLGRLQRARLSLAIVVGFILIAMLAGPVLDAATRLVGALPISSSFFGVAVLGVAAALPELSTAVAALRHGERDMAAGILIGSNVTNPMFAAGVGAVISTYDVPSVVILYDLPVKMATGALIGWIFWSREWMPRRHAWALIAAYVAYLQLRVLWFPLD
jgi:cation:H+ antiporter